ncbi:MAG: HEAT repeat domain-containing protein [Verrucomicrobia bacterium]|nr:HEAT repeat domain-containing protein [Verrucomicrobiota bacterium]
MGLLAKCLICTCAASALWAATPAQEAKMQALYLMQQKKVEESIERYRELANITGRHDFEVLQQMGLTLLQKGIQSEDPQAFLMTLFGAGLSNSARALEILEKGLKHPDPQVQLLSLNFIGRQEDDRADELLNVAMSSDFLATRMEAAFHLALKKHPHAVGQIEGLMFRLPPVFKPYFPPLFALIGTNDATAVLKRLIEDTDPQVRVESILQVAHMGRDDFLPLLRKRLSLSNISELEATCFSMGALKDSSVVPKLKKLSASPTESIRITAALALLRLGDRTGVPALIEMAKNRNLFAIAALGNVSESEEVLADLVQANDLQIRINAAVALLQLRDPRCAPVLSEMFIQDARDLAFHPYGSIGRTLTAWKAVPSAELRSNDPTIDLSFSLAMREHILRESIHLPEADFLNLAKEIIHRQQNDLIPILIGQLENLQTEGAISLLKSGAAKLTSPLIRDYCHLALYRLKIEGPYEEYVKNWVMHQKGSELIRLRPMLPWKYRLEQSDFSLTPDETSRLLIESFLSIANQRDEKSIDFLLKAIQHGNPQNRYALMGLLMRATE